MGAHVLDFQLQLVLGSLVGALRPHQYLASVDLKPLIGSGMYLEGQVLKEVRRAVGLVGFGPASGVDPHADGRGLSPWLVLGRDLRRVSRTAQPLTGW